MEKYNYRDFKLDKEGIKQGILELFPHFLKVTGYVDPKNLTTYVIKYLDYGKRG